MADEQEDMTPEQIAQLQRDNCIFCKLVSGDIPSKKVYEDTDFVGLLDINPAIEGHVLLLPKQHFQILPQIPQDIVGNLGIACGKVSSKIIKAFKCEGTSVFIANGAVAGQRAPHFMVHIMPRKEGDNISLNPKLADIDERLFNTVKDRLLSSMKVPRATSNSINTAPQEEPKPNDSNISQEAKEIQDETELEEEHRLKKERDLKREKEKTNKNTKSNEKTDIKSLKSSNKIDFDKLSRLLDK